MWGGHSCPPVLTFPPLVKALLERKNFKRNNKSNNYSRQECPPHKCVAPEVVLLSLLAVPPTRIAT
jgi:hypothetical protein